MSTNDVPGFNPVNKDVLACGCWAEHTDGSLIFVESTEDNRVIYSIFDTSRDPIVEYRDSMPENDFCKNFSWTCENSKYSKKIDAKWTWHDKQNFPWNKVIASGAKDGLRYASVAAVVTVAERLAQSLKLRAQTVSSDKSHLVTRTASKLGGMLKSLGEKLLSLDSRS